MLVLPVDSLTVWQKFYETNAELVYKYIVKKIKYAVLNNLDSVEMFKFGVDGDLAYIKKEKYVASLNDAMKVFIKNEHYEYAQQCKSIIDTFHVHRLINETVKKD